MQPSARFRRVVSSGPCVLCATRAGHRDPHHLIPQQSLRRHVASLRLDEMPARRLLRVLLSDVRGGVALCRSCHANVEAGSIPLPRGKVPDVAWIFAAELGDWAVVGLERTYKPQGGQDGNRNEG